MADEWKSFFNSDDGDSEFEGFSLSDIDEAETRRKYHMTEKSFLKMNFIGSPFELSKNLTNRSHFNTTHLNGKICHYDCACVCLQQKIYVILFGDFFFRFVKGIY
jgi:hypothetical protein